MNRSPAETLAELVHAGQHLDPCQLNGILREIRPLLHGPLHRHGTASVTALFKRAGYVSDGIACPAADLTVYRGELTGSGQPGIAWTTDRQVAVKYARDYSTAGDVQVRQATASPAAVLAQFTAESEVVVDPVLLAGAKVIARMPHFKLPLLS